jgi:2-oxoisovalerate dehydrogenase E2 component (dihydrolipoyl transacylase)
LNGAPESEPEKSNTLAGQEGEALTEPVKADVKTTGEVATKADSETSPEPVKESTQPQKKPGKFATLAVPAVRHLVKELKLNIEDIEGTGRDGRVTKEDVQKFAQRLKEGAATTSSITPSPAPVGAPEGKDYVKPLTPVQNGMFKQMTRSLSIPHFLYSDSVDLTGLNALRKKFNANKEKGQRLTPLPFIVKAVSLSLQQFPLLNAHLDTTTNPEKPQMLIKGQHNIGIAVDSPAGLLVPVVKNVQSHSIESLAAEISRLSKLGREGKLTTADLTGATFTVSNIGSIGGAAVSPVIVSPQVGILGIGKARIVPAFGENGELVKKEECVFSWSADHRVIDGAMAARCAESVRGFLENIETMLVRLR